MRLDVVLPPYLTVPSGAQSGFHAVDFALLVGLHTEGPGAVYQLSILGAGHPLPSVERLQVSNLGHDGLIPVVREQGVDCLLEVLRRGDVPSWCAL